MKIIVRNSRAEENLTWMKYLITSSKGGVNQAGEKGKWIWRKIIWIYAVKGAQRIKGRES
jgi:hypothetical protein